MDFLHDVLYTGRRFRLLPIIDTLTKECFWIEADTSIGGQRVIQVLTRIAAINGLPEQIVVDNGPEFISNVVDAWAYARGVKLQFIRPGKTVNTPPEAGRKPKSRPEACFFYWALREFGISYLELAKSRRNISIPAVRYSVERGEKIAEIADINFRILKYFRVSPLLPY
jgi:hypothetical protein